METCSLNKNKNQKLIAVINNLHVQITKLYTSTKMHTWPIFTLPMN